MRNRFSLSAASWARVCVLRYWVIEMPARMMISVITMSSSIIVKPLRRRSLATLIPIAVFRAIESRTLVLGIHVVHVLAAPRRGVRFVLVGAQAPIVGAGRGIDRNAAQEFQL